MESQVVTWIIFCAVLIPSLIFALNFGRKMWIEILKVVSVKSAKAFRFLTCGSIDITLFRLEHNYEPSDDDQQDVGYEFELKQNAAKDSRLQGFKAKDEDEQKSRKQQIDKLRNKLETSKVNQINYEEGDQSSGQVKAKASEGTDSLDSYKDQDVINESQQSSQ